MPDDPGQELVKAAAAGGVQGFLETIAPGFVETGQWSADFIRRYRLRTQIKTLIRAKEMCEEAGIPPEAISYKVLVPLLENAGLEDDPEEADDPEAAAAMHERWSALLANAASGDAGPDVSPSFPAILAELTAAEAAMLNRLAGYEHAIDQERLVEQMGAPTSRPGIPNPERERALVRIGNLQRLGLCEIEPPDGGEPGPGGRTFYPLTSKYWTGVRITRFGRTFLVACTPPTASTEDGGE